jgi:hypothetical protein
VVEELVVQDAGISGASRHDRPRLLELMARIPEFDVLLAFDFSRLARDMEDLGWIRNRLRAARKTAIEASTGREIHDIGARVLGVLNEEYLAKLRDDTRRGLRGRVERGLSAGLPAYGYRTERSPRRNGWSPTAIRELLRNSIYRGEYVWSRSEWVKDHETGRRRRFERPESEWVIQRIPLVHFQKGQHKEAVARPYLEAAAREGGNGRVVLIGIAQEKASIWRSWKRKGHERLAHPHMEWGRQMAFIHHFYFYLWDPECAPRRAR